jgi:hypothetical protein
LGEGFLRFRKLRRLVSQNTVKRLAYKVAGFKTRPVGYRQQLNRSAMRALPFMRRLKPSIQPVSMEEVMDWFEKFHNAFAIVGL